MRDDALHVTNYIKNINGDLIISLTDMYSELCLLYNIIFVISEVIPDLDFIV